MVALTLENGKASLKVKVEVYSHFDAKKQSLRPTQVSFFKDGSYSANDHFIYSPTDAAIGVNMFHLDKTFQEWLRKGSAAALKVFGMSYPDYLAAVEARLGPDSEGLHLTLPNVHFRLVPGSNGAASGAVSFVSADLSNYTKTNAVGETVPRKLLECLDLACLNESGISYKIQGPILVLLSPDKVVQMLDGIPVYEHQEFAVNLTFMRKPN